MISKLLLDVQDWLFIRSGALRIILNEPDHEGSYIDLVLQAASVVIVCESETKIFA
jgi:hypothetical protein